MLCEQGENKTYYWMKFQKDFFKSLRIKRLRRLAGGDTFTIIYLKLQLLSISQGGYLEYKHIFDSFEEEMAEEIEEELDNVRVTVGYLLQNELMVKEADSYFLPYAAANTGKETASTLRSRECRLRKKEALLLQCNSDATDLQQPGNTEIEIEKEIDKDIISEVVAFLNQTCGCHYQASTPKTRSLIKARIKEGFTLDDFKTVITKMNKAWGADAKMKQYLRPETLFGTKFEGYLNRPEETEAPKRNSFGEIVRADYDLDALEKMLNG